MSFGFVLEGNVKDADALKAALEKITTYVSEKLGGVNTYSLSVSEDGTKFLFVEIYESDETFLTKLNDKPFSEILGSVLATIDITSNRVFGKVGPDAKKALDNFGSVYFPHHYGWNSKKK